jgi:hypothetical protein
VKLILGIEVKQLILLFLGLSMPALSVKKTSGCIAVKSKLLHSTVDKETFLISANCAASAKMKR